MLIDGHIYLSTGEGKKVRHQLKDNPKFELSVANDRGQWLRINGKAVFDTTPELLEKAFEIKPSPKEIYAPGTGNTPALFYIANGQATLADMQGKSETFKL